MHASRLERFTRKASGTDLLKDASTSVKIADATWHVGLFVKAWSQSKSKENLRTAVMVLEKSYKDNGLDKVRTLPDILKIEVAAAKKLNSKPITS